MMKWFVSFSITFLLFNTFMVSGQISQKDLADGSAIFMLPVVNPINEEDASTFLNDFNQWLDGAGTFPEAFNDKVMGAYVRMEAEGEPVSGEVQGREEVKNIFASNLPDGSVRRIENVTFDLPLIIIEGTTVSLDGDSESYIQVFNLYQSGEGVQAGAAGQFSHQGVYWGPTFSEVTALLNQYFTGIDMNDWDQVSATLSAYPKYLFMVKSTTEAGALVGACCATKDQVEEQYLKYFANNGLAITEYSIVMRRYSLVVVKGTRTFLDSGVSSHFTQTFVLDNDGLISRMYYMAASALPASVGASYATVASAAPSSADIDEAV